MDIKYAVRQLEKNKHTFHSLLNGATEAEYSWRSADDKWNLLTIVCHLYDEEREDFRARFKDVIETPDQKPLSFDPEAWIIEHDYANQDFEKKLSLFLSERDISIKYLNELKTANLDQGYPYKDYGLVNGKFFLANWLAHDYLHIKQITRVKYDYLANVSKQKIDYAGKWT